MIDVRNLSREDKLHKIIEDMPSKYENKGIRRTIFPEKEMTTDEIMHFFSMILDDIGYILDSPSTLIEGKTLLTSRICSYSLDDLIKVILGKCEKDDMSIGYYNVCIDDNNLLNIYAFRMFYYDDIGRSNRRSRETKINDILSFIS
jgi:hypothetical protein